MSIGSQYQTFHRLLFINRGWRDECGAFRHLILLTVPWALRSVRAENRLCGIHTAHLLGPPEWVSMFSGPQTTGWKSGFIQKFLPLATLTRVLLGYIPSWSEFWTSSHFSCSRPHLISFNLDPSKITYPNYATFITLNENFPVPVYKFTEFII
jgi:hypothetical protein